MNQCNVTILIISQLNYLICCFFFFVQKFRSGMHHILQCDIPISRDFDLQNFSWSMKIQSQAHNMVEIIVQFKYRTMYSFGCPTKCRTMKSFTREWSMKSAVVEEFHRPKNFFIRRKVAKRALISFRRYSARKFLC